VKISPEAFSILFELTKRYNWLESKSPEVLELWNSCDTAHQQKLITSLLERFHYLTGAATEIGCQDIANTVVNQWKADPLKTWIVATADGDKADGSQMFLQSLKSGFARHQGWNEDNFVSTIGKAPHKVMDGDTVVLVDDFVGTGKTAARKLKWLHEKLKVKPTRTSAIYFISLAAMQTSRTNVEAQCTAFYSYRFLPRGISDFYADEQLAVAVSAMKAMEAKLAPTWKSRNLTNYSFGYGGSETLYFQEGASIPNNSFPLFWWPQDSNARDRQVLFRRINP
jgi:hypothetical protein